MTDMEKKVMVRLCAKILSETDLYDTDMEVRNLIDWICVSEQIKSNNNEIRSITGEYKRIEPDCREGVRTQLEHMKSLCKERESLYEKQNDLKGQKQKIERALPILNNSMPVSASCASACRKYLPSVQSPAKSCVTRMVPAEPVKPEIKARHLKCSPTYSL